MHIRMATNSGLSLPEMDGFISASEGVEFQGQGRGEIYGWVEATLVQWEYHSQGKKQKGTIRSYIRKMTGLSMPQVTRLMRAGDGGRADAQVASDAEQPRGLRAGNPGGGVQPFPVLLPGRPVCHRMRGAARHVRPEPPPGVVRDGPVVREVHAAPPGGRGHQH